jgi:predicted ATP-grasp superfamily ATP-dependent carboligase
VVQEYIPGGDDSIYSFHTYFDRNSNPLAYFVGRKIRDYPREFGQSTYLELTKNKEVVSLGLDLLKRIGYIGLAKIDFKQDARTGQFYILEINPRATLWNYMGAASGINLLMIAYNDILGEKTDLPTDYRTDIRWLSFEADLKGFLRDYHKDGDLTWGQWLLSYWSRKVYAVFCWKDPAPFLAYGWFYAKALFKRLTKKSAAS